MPSLSIYLTDEIYFKLRQCGEKPSELVQRLLEEYFRSKEKQTLKPEEGKRK